MRAIIALAISVVLLSSCAKKITDSGTTASRVDYNNGSPEQKQPAPNTELSDAKTIDLNNTNLPAKIEQYNPQNK